LLLYKEVGGEFSFFLRLIISFVSRTHKHNYVTIQSKGISSHKN